MSGRDMPVQLTHYFTYAPGTTWLGVQGTEHTAGVVDKVQALCAERLTILNDGDQQTRNRSARRRLRYGQGGESAANLITADKFTRP